MALNENRTSGDFEERKQCIGDSQICPGADTLPPFVQAFGQDDGGEIYLLGTSIPSIDPSLPPAGVIYQIADPARYNRLLVDMYKINTQSSHRRNNPQTCKRSRKVTPMLSTVGTKDQ